MIKGDICFYFGTDTIILMTKEGAKKLLVVIVLSVVGLLLLPWIGSILGLSALLAILPFAAQAPLLFFILSIILFVALFLANYNKKFRKKIVNYYMRSRGIDEQYAYVVLEQVLANLNPILVAGTLIIGGLSLATFLGY